MRRAVYIAPKFRRTSEAFIGAVLLHEIGHIYDARHVSWEEREQFAAHVGVTRPLPRAGTGGDSAGGASSARAPGGYPLTEWFAMAYSECAGSRQPTGSLGYKLGPLAHAEVCKLIRRAYSR